MFKKLLRYLTELIKKVSMKFYEKRLLDSLQAQEVPEAPLNNVLKAMGHIGQTVGNPLTKTEISISINLIFADGAGAILLPAALPVALQSSIPVWLLGLTDFYSGYLKSSIINSLQPGWIFVPGGLAVGVYGYTANLPPAFVPTIGLLLQYGDVLLQFQDAGAVNFAFVIIRCNNVAYGTFLNSFVSDLITVSHIRYFAPNINQFINPVIFGYQTLFGKVSTDSLDPRMYILSTEPQQNICDLPLNLPIDKNLMIGFQQSVFCQVINWVLFVEKVEPLTHKRIKR